MKKIIVIGHRGVMGYEPENTLRSFKKAIQLGVDAIELDVHLSKDKKLVVIHDKSVNRTTNGKGLVKNLTLIELKRLNAGKGEKIPTLQEVFDLIKKKCYINIELKSPHVEEPVVAIIKKNRVENKVLLSSFKLAYLKNSKRQYNKLMVGLLHYGKITNEIEKAKKAGCDLFLPHYAFITKEVVKKVHKSGMKIMVWNVEKKKDILRIIKFTLNN